MATSYYTLMGSLPHLPPFERAERLPISRLKLEQRLRMLDPEDAEELTRAEILAAWQMTLAKPRTDAEMVARYREAVEATRRPALREFLEFRFGPQTLVAALRRRKAGLPAPDRGEPWGIGPWVTMIKAHWEEPDFRLAILHRWLPEARKHLDDEDALALERLLLDVVWQRLSRIAESDPFGFEKEYGFFLPRGASVPALDPDKKWPFTPSVAMEAKLPPGGVIGSVPEGPFNHKIMVPFNEPEPVEITWVRSGSVTVEETVARYRDASGIEREVKLARRWPVIICNTSSMPVAAREASIYTGITLGEYFRQMGYHVLLIADSTSRWAQAMRETSGRMEEIPGEEAFPAYLDSSIKSVYERASLLRCPDGSVGSLTLVGTVSPGGGNFEEPVTQSTLGTVKTFLGLSADRAYRRFYPAIDPLISWSRYLDQLAPWFAKELDAQWVGDVKRMQALLERGDTIYQMMQVTGEEGITLEDFVDWQKSLLIDMVYLQQDAFDEVDACMPRERQKESFRLLLNLVDGAYPFKDKNEVRDFFTRLTGLYKNWNYSAAGSPEFGKYRKEIEELVSFKRG